MAGQEGGQRRPMRRDEPPTDGDDFEMPNRKKKYYN